jgi:hypothetical protein
MFSYTTISAEVGRTILNSIAAKKYMLVCSANFYFCKSTVTMLDELYTAMILYLIVSTLPLECISSAQRYNYKKSAINYNYNGSHLHYRKKVRTKTVSKPTDAAASIPSHQWTEGIHYKSVKKTRVSIVESHL